MKFRSMITRIIPKILSVIIMSLLLVGTALSVSGADHPLVLSNGKTVYYSGTNTEVMIPENYEMQDQYLRGAWVTPLAGSIPGFKNESQYKQEILEVFEVLEYYNCNAMVFHIRIMNDALYPSELNPKSGYMNTNVDYLTWVIDECHKRGIEFHAWLNPYRVQASGSKTLEQIANTYKQTAPKNPASDVKNMLRNSSGGVILNPGLQNVRDFIIDTCMEIVEKYDVDAIHFDDYFYISDVDDNDLYQSNNPDGLGKSDWRRQQVDLFIEKLSKTMREYNKENNRYVQLGISPTGIYNNGDGVVTYDEEGNAISTGSKTGGQNHYESYLFSDTLKWINKEWIDYITPQSYWAFSHTIAGYADVMSWWDKVVKYKDVNLYSGMGIYMAETPGRNYSWGFDPNEAPNQLKYATTLKNVDGTIFYSYNYLEYTYKGNRDSLYGQGLTTIKNDMFTNPAILPRIKSMSCEADKIDKITSTSTDQELKLSFDKVENAKFYVVYRSEGVLTYEPEQVYKIFGSKEDVVTFTDKKDGKDYNYGIRVLSKANTLSEPIEHLAIRLNVVFKDNNGNVLSTQEVGYGQSAKAPDAPVKEGSTFVGWSRDYSYVTKDLVLTPKYNDSDFIVTFYDRDGKVVSQQAVPYKGSAEAPADAPSPGFVFDKWIGDYTNVTMDVDIYAEYKEKFCLVTVVDHDGTELLSYEIKYGKTGYFPEAPTRDGYVFVGWSDNLDPVLDDITVTPLYEKEMFEVTLINGYDGSIIDVLKVGKYEDAVLPEPPKVPGFRFISWSGNYENVRFNVKVTAEYEEIYFDLYFYDINGNELETYTYFVSEERYYPEAPVVEGYEFVKWDIDYDNLPVELFEIHVKPIYKSLIDPVKIIFLGFNDEVLLELDYIGGEIELPEAPAVEGYEFKGWDKEVKEELVEQTIKAIYEKIVTSVKITFLGFNDEVVLELEYFGGEIELPEAPAVEGYEFKGWDKEVKEELEEQTIKAIYEQKKYKVSYVYNNEVIFEEEVLHGEDATFSFEKPTVDGFSFEKFSSDGKNITSDTTIELIFSKVNASSCNFMSLIKLSFMMSFVVIVALFTKKK